MADGGGGEDLGAGDVPGMGGCGAAALDEAEAGCGVDTGSGLGAALEEGGVLTGGGVGEADPPGEVGAGDDGGAGDEGAVAVLPVGEAKDGEVLCGEVHIVGVLADDLGAGVVGGGEGLEEVVVAVEVVVVHLGDVVGIDVVEHEVVVGTEGGGGGRLDPVDAQAEFPGARGERRGGREAVGEDDGLLGHLLLRGEGGQDVRDLPGPDRGDERGDGGLSTGPLPHADGGQDGVHPVAVGVAAPDLALGEVGHAVAQGGVGDQGALDVPCLVAVLDDGQSAGGQECSCGGAGCGDHRGAAGGDLQDASGEHGGAGDDGIDIEEGLVPAVGAEHLGVVEGAAHVGVVRSGELVGGISPQVAGEDVQTGGQPGRRIDGCAEKDLHLGAALRVLVGEVRAGEGDVPQWGRASVVTEEPDGVVDGRLGGEGQGADTIVAEVVPVAVQERLVGGEDPVEQPGGVDGLVVVGGVLLVPEDGGNAGGAQGGYQLPKVRGRAPGADDPVAPGIGVAVPGGLDEKEVDRRVLDLFAPPVGRERHSAPLVLEGERGELVGDDAHRDVVPGSSR